MSESDQQLLCDYAERGSETAFAELVSRHVDLVHSAAERLTGDAHLAHDVTQGVFLALARQAAALARHPVLSGWLHGTARNLAAKTVRTETRRHAREQEAAAMNELLAGETPDAPWEHVAPHLDAALGELTATDRDAVMLRYFEKKSAAEMAVLLGISSDAAQKRVSRAVERLRDIFAAHKITISAGGLTALLAANAVKAAPAGLAAAIAAAIPAFSSFMLATKLKLIIATLAVAGLGAALVLQHQTQTGLRTENAALRRQITQLQTDDEALSNRLAGVVQSNQLSQEQFHELLKLRGEVSLLHRQQSSHSEPIATETNALPEAETTQILMTPELVLVPNEYLSAFGLNAVTADASPGILPPEQFEVAKTVLEKASDVKVLSTPRIVTMNGTEARISIYKSVPVGDTNASVGISFSVTPSYSSDSDTIDLNTIATLNQLSEDPLVSGVQSIQVTNQVKLLAGQTVILFKPDVRFHDWMGETITNLPGPTANLLMFLTPKVVRPSDFKLKQ